MDVARQSDVRVLYTMAFSYDRAKYKLSVAICRGALNIVRDSDTMKNSGHVYTLI